MKSRYNQIKDITDIAALILIFLISILLTFSCIQVEPVDETRTISPENDFSKISRNLIMKSNFIETLNNKYPDSRDPDKVNLLALTYLFSEGLKTDQNESNMILLKRVLNCDAIKYPDSIKYVFREIFSNYGEGLGFENTFIDSQIPKRVEFILSWNGYHDILNPFTKFGFDQLGQDVLGCGVPELISFEDSEITVRYPNIQNAPIIKYFKEELEGYKAVKLMEGLSEVKHPWGESDNTLGKPISSMPNNLDISRMNNMVGKIADPLSYERIDYIAIVPFIIPEPDSGLWNGMYSFGDYLWNNYRAGFDIWGSIKKHKKKTPSSINLRITSIVTDEKDTIFSESFIREVSIPPIADTISGFHTRIFTDLIRKGPAKGKKKKTYSMGVRIEDLINKKVIELREFNTLPDSNVEVYESRPMFLSKYQDDNRPKPGNPWSEIPNFTYISEFSVGDSLKVWFPIIGLEKNTETYDGEINVFLVPNDMQKRDARVTIGDIYFSKNSDSLPKPPNDSAKSFIGFNKYFTVSIPVTSKSRNKYATISFIIPKLPEGSYTLYIQTRTSYGNSKESRVIAISERDLHILNR